MYYKTNLEPEAWLIQRIYSVHHNASKCFVHKPQVVEYYSTDLSIGFVQLPTLRSLVHVCAIFVLSELFFICLCYLSNFCTFCIILVLCWLCLLIYGFWVIFEHPHPQCFDTIA